jgi:hypothetical protein
MCRQAPITADVIAAELSGNPASSGFERGLHKVGEVISDASSVSW